MSVVFGMVCEGHSMTSLHFKVVAMKNMKCTYKYFTVQINWYIHLLLLPPNISESNFCYVYPSSSCPLILQDFPHSSICVHDAFSLSSLRCLWLIPGPEQVNFSNLSLTKKKLTNMFRNKQFTCPDTASSFWHNCIYD